MKGTAVVLAALLVAFLAGCEEKTEEVREAPSASEIVDTYVDKLTTAPEMARGAAEAADERTEAEKRALEALE